MFSHTIRARVLVLAVSAALFPATQSLAQDFSAKTDHHHKKNHHGAYDVGEVSKSKEYGKELLHPVPTQKQIFKRGYAQKILGRAEIEAAGPVANAADILSFAPGVSVGGSYGNSGATKMQININGIKQGWGHLKGDVSGHSIMVTFDGIPMNDPATGLWQSPQVNQPSILQSVSVVYGPGNPDQRWYNNLGGGITFIPVQPTRKAGGEVGIAYGSFDTENIHFRVDTGLHDGFAAVIAGGASQANSFLSAPAGSTLPLSQGTRIPGYSYAWYFKGIKKFHGGDVSLGAYLAKGDSYKPYEIPLAPISGVTINGYDGKKENTGPLYSEQTSGFYTALPYKNDSNSTWLLYGKGNFDIGAKTKLHAMVWYRHGKRQHFQEYGYNTQNLNYFEANTPTDDVYGTKVYFVSNLPWNRLSYGGYILHSRYHTINSFWNPTIDPKASYENPNGKFRSNYFDQTLTAAFLQDRIHPLHNVSITPGFRVIGIQTNYSYGTCEKFPLGCQNSPEHAEGNPANNPGVTPYASTNFSQVEPSVSVNWRPLHHVALFASYSSAYQTPANGGGGGPYQSLPASSLSLEKSSYYQAGVKFHVAHGNFLHDFLASANWYFIHMSNQYIPVTLANGDVYNASGTSDYQGVNLYMTDKPMYWLHVFSNLSFEKANYTTYTISGHDYSGLPVSYVPSTLFNVGAYSKWYYGGVLLEPRIWVKYVGTQSIFDNEAKIPSTQKMPDYATLNLALHTVIPVQDSILHHISVGLTFKNITGNRYNGYEYISSGKTFGGDSKGALLGFPGAPREIYASLSAKF